MKHTVRPSAGDVVLFYQAGGGLWSVAHLEMGQNSHQGTRGPQVWSVFPFSRVPFWVPIFDPHPFGDDKGGLPSIPAP